MGKSIYIEDGYHHYQEFLDLDAIVFLGGERWFPEYQDPDDDEVYMKLDIIFKGGAKMELIVVRETWQAIKKSLRS